MVVIDKAKEATSLKVCSFRCSICLSTIAQVLDKESTKFLLRKTLISSQNIPNFTNRSFYSYASNNTAMNPSIFLHPKITLSATAKTKWLSLEEESQVTVTRVNQLPIGHQIFADELHPPCSAFPICKLFQAFPSYYSNHLKVVALD